MYAFETGTGAYITGSGTSELTGADAAANYGGGPQAWDMDWSWGSEAVPLEYAGFSIGLSAQDVGYSVTLTPSAVPVPAAVWLFGSGLLGLVGIRRKMKH
jgi:hypothetical protein